MMRDFTCFEIGGPRNIFWAARNQNSAPELAQDQGGKLGNGTHTAGSPTIRAGGLALGMQKLDPLSQARGCASNLPNSAAGWKTDCSTEEDCTWLTVHIVCDPQAGKKAATMHYTHGRSSPLPQLQRIRGGLRTVLISVPKYSDRALVGLGGRLCWFHPGLGTWVLVFSQELLVAVVLVATEVAV